MSEYEIQSLEVARHTLWAYWSADAIAAVALVAAIIGGFIAYRNMKIIILNSLLSLEQDMANRRTKFADIAAQMKDNNVPIETLQSSFDEAKENYFNSLDRLASSILNGHFPDLEMKQDYKDVITDVVRTFHNDFQTGTRFRKIVKLYERWQDVKK